MLPLTKMEQHIDYLYHRHQVSLFMADNADCEQSRRVHRELAEGYAVQIAQAKASPALASALRAGKDQCRSLSVLGSERSPTRRAWRREAGADSTNIAGTIHANLRAALQSARRLRNGPVHRDTVDHWTSLVCAAKAEH